MAVKKKEDSLTTIEHELKAALVPEDEQPFPIPKNWAWTRFKVCFRDKTSSDKKLPQNQYEETGEYAVIDQGQQLIGGYTNDASLVFNGILPVIIFGDHTRAVKWVDFDFVQGADGVKVFQPEQNLNAKFLYYWITVVELPDKGYSRHSKFLRVTAVPIPPLPEQKCIAERLDSLLGKIKEAKALLDEIPEILQNFRQTVLAAATSGELTKNWQASNRKASKKMPWTSKPLGELVESSANGLSKRHGEAGEATVVLRLADFKDAMRINGNERKIRLTEKEVDKYRLDRGDLLIVRVNGSRDIAGKFIVHMSQSDSVETYCDHFIRLKVKTDKLDPSYARYVGNSLDGRKHIESVLVTSAGQNTINQPSLFRLLIPLPPIEEQQEIVRRVESLFSKADSLEAQYKDAMDLIESLPEIILSKAFRGKLVPQDPNDEPAAALLERITIEKSRETEKVEDTKKKKHKQNV